MKRILTESMIDSIKDRATVELIEDFLNSNHHLPRTHAAITIGLRMHKNYSQYSTLLLEEMNQEIHFSNVSGGVKSAWSIAVSLAENLREVDYPKLKAAFKKWDSDEQKNLLEWIADFPEQQAILR